MEKRAFGKTGMQVSVLGFGGAEIGFEKARQEDVARLLNQALDAGLNVIDTAECYMDSEEKIGKAVSSRRKDFHLFTKCGHPDSPGVADWRPESLLKSIERSLQRLKTDRVDLVQLHTCTLEDLKRGDVISALQTARDKGYTRFIGYSGDSKAAKYAIECGAFDSLQTSLSIADQEAIDLTIPLARARGMGVIAKRPLGNAVWRYSTRPEVGYHQPYWDRVQKLKYDFLKDDPAQVSSIALRFTLGIPGVDVAIVGTKNPERWKENAKLLEAGPLPSDKFEAIRKRWKDVADASWIGLT